MQYAKRMVGRKMYGGTSTYIPLKVNMAGVIPVIFASSLLYIPVLIVQFSDQTGAVAQCHRANFQRGTEPLYLFIFAVLIIFFCYFYVSITFNPIEVADNMKKYGGFIPGIRAGRPTAEYLDYVADPPDPAGLDLPGVDRDHPALRVRLPRRLSQLHLRRHEPADHGRRRPGHREADRGQLQQRNYEGFLR